MHQKNLQGHLSHSLLIINYKGSIRQKEICYQNTNLYHWQAGRKLLHARKIYIIEQLMVFMVTKTKNG